MDNNTTDQEPLKHEDLLMLAPRSNPPSVEGESSENPKVSD